MGNIIDSSKVMEFIGKRLYNFNAAEELAWAWNSGENIIMFGPGGYGKSDAALLFHKYLVKKGHVKSKPFIMSFGQGMTEEKLLGGIDMKEFQSSGEIKYLLQNAFINNEVVIFEELWDAFPAVLLILKDILQSRCVRMGNQVVPIKTKIVIACTNRSREEVVEDASTEALMQRFLFEKEVKWEKHTPNDYVRALKNATSNFNSKIANLVATICAASNTEDYCISPRTCGKAYKSALINGIRSLSGMHGLSKGLAEYKEIRAAEEKVKNANDEIRNCISVINNNIDKLKSIRSFRHFAPVYKEMYEACMKLDDLSVPDDVVEKKNDVRRQARKVISSLSSHVNVFIKNPPAHSIPSRFKYYFEQKDFHAAYKLLK